MHGRALLRAGLVSAPLLGALSLDIVLVAVLARERLLSGLAEQPWVLVLFATLLSIAAMCGSQPRLGGPRGVSAP